MDVMLVRLIASQVCLHASMTGLRMAAPLLALREGQSASAIGILLALFALAPVFLSLPAGRFADRHGLKRPVAYSVAVATGGVALAVVWPIFPVLCLAALLVGGAAGAAAIALQRHAGRTAHDAHQLKQVFSWLALGPAVANFIGPFAAGLLIDHAGPSPASAEGFRAAFGLLALLPLLAWACVRGTIELPPAPQPEGARSAGAWDLLNEPGFRRLLLVNWLLSSCWDVHTFVLPLLGHERGLSASAIGTILGAFAVAAAVVRVLMPFVAARLRERVVVAGAMAITAALFGLYPLMPTAWAMGLCSVGLGFVLGSVQPMMMSLLHQLTPHHRHGEALGLRMMTINASSVLMPMLFGSLGALLGVGALFWLVGGSVLGGARVAWRMGATPTSAAKTSD